MAKKLWITNMFNHRTKVIVIVLLLCCLFQISSAQAKAQNYRIETSKITEQVFVLSVAWSDTSYINSAIVIGDSGVMLITSQMEPVAQSLEAKIKELTAKPITHVLNIASDTFHHHANDYFKERGAEIISHKELGYSEATTQVLFEPEFSMQFGSELVKATYIPAHTKGQTIVFLENSNLMLLGDAFRTDKLVYTGYHGVEGQLNGFAQAYEIANDETLIVSGHKGERLFSKRSALLQASHTLNKFSKLVGRKHKAGMSLEQMINDQELRDAVSIYQIYKKQPSLIQYNITQLIETEFTEGFEIKETELEKFVGRYTDTKAGIFEVESKYGHLFIKQKGKFLFKLTAMAADKFYIWKSDTACFYMQFELSSDGEVIGISPKIPEESYWYTVIPEGMRQKV